MTERPRRVWLLAGVAALIFGAGLIGLAFGFNDQECQYSEADVDIAIFGSKRATQKEMQQLKALEAKIEGLRGVEFVSLRSAQQARALFETILGDEPELQESLPDGMHEAGHFAASLRIVVAGDAEPEAVADQIPDPAVVDDIVVAPEPDERAAAELLPAGLSEEDICLTEDV